MSNAKKVSLAHIRKHFVRLTEIEQQLLVLNQDCEKLEKSLRDIKVKLKDLHSILSFVLSIPETPIDKNTPIEALGLGIRVELCLKSGLIFTVGQLLAKTERDIRRLPNMGKLTFSKLTETLDRYGLKLSSL